MSFPARQASGADSLGLAGRCSASGICWRSLGHRAVSNGVRTGWRLFGTCLLHGWFRHWSAPDLVRIGMWWRQQTNTLSKGGLMGRHER